MWYKDIGNFRIGKTMEDLVFFKFINWDKKENYSDWKYELQFLKWFFCFGYKKEIEEIDN